MTVTTIGFAALLCASFAVFILLATRPHDDSAMHRDLETTIASIPVQAVAENHR